MPGKTRGKGSPKNSLKQGLSRFLSKTVGGSPSQSWFPELDNIAGKYEDYRQPLGELCVNGKQFVLKLEMPGVERKSLSVVVRGGGLEVKGERASPYVGEGGDKGACFYEREYVGFYRFVMLPPEAGVDGAKARYHDGVLEIILPRKPAEKLEQKRIVVN